MFILAFVNVMNVAYIIYNWQVHVEFTDKEDKIRIEGPPEEVDKAQKDLEEMARDLVQKLTFEEIAVDPKYYKHIIGKSGANGMYLMTCWINYETWQCVTSLFPILFCFMQFYEFYIKQTLQCNNHILRSLYLSDA
jgi:hypothetical protein